jgi:hypothetical protein
LRRNCSLKHVIERKVKGRTEVMGRRRKKRKQPHDELKETRKLEEEALGRAVWRTRFGRGYGPVVRETVE